MSLSRRSFVMAGAFCLNPVGRDSVEPFVPHKINPLSASRRCLRDSPEKQFPLPPLHVRYLPKRINVVDSWESIDLTIQILERE
jgi:hypothetical protein